MNSKQIEKMGGDIFSGFDCKICGEFIGEYFIGEDDKLVVCGIYEDFGDAVCPKCGQPYEYTESHGIVLTTQQLKKLR